MPETVAPAPATTPAAVTPKTDADYRAAAVAALKSPPPEVEAKKEEPKPAEPKKEEKPPEAAENWFQKLAKREAEFRAERETAQKALEAEKARFKTFEELGRVIDPVTLQRAVASRDPMAFLQSAGFSYKDVVDAVMKAQPGAAKPEEPAKLAEDPKVAVLEKRLAELEAERQATAVRDARAKLVEMGQKHLDKEKFPFAAKFGAESLNEALDLLNDFHAKTGRLPADNPDDNFRIALAEIEARHKKIAERYGIPLTSAAPVASVPSESPARTPGTEDAHGQTTLSSSMSPSGGSGGGTPMTDADYQARAAAQLRALRK